MRRKPGRREECVSRACTFLVELAEECELSIYSPTKNRDEIDDSFRCTVVVGWAAVPEAVSSAGSCAPVCGFQMVRFLWPPSTTLVSISFGDELTKK